MADEQRSKGSHGHDHTDRCYWDYLECHWVCRPASDDEPIAVAVGATGATGAVEE